MKVPVNRFYEFLERPLELWSRFLLVLTLVPLVLSLTQPLWQIRMVAPQYPNGLQMDIYTYKLEGGNGGRDIQEINTLNHYIGMRKLNREELADLDWLPFAFGVLALLTLRVAAIGNVRSLIDLSVLTVYFACFSLARFVFKLYTYGHNLDPQAPFHMDPFIPGMFGEQHIANFTSSSYPQLGSFLFAAFVAGVLGLMAYHLAKGRLQAVRAEMLSLGMPVPS